MQRPSRVDVRPGKHGGYLAKQDASGKHQELPAQTTEPLCRRDGTRLRAQCREHQAQVPDRLLDSASESVCKEKGNVPGVQCTNVSEMRAPSAFWRGKKSWKCKRGLSKRGLAQNASLRPERLMSGQFLIFTVAIQAGGAVCY